MVLKTVLGWHVSLNSNVGSTYTMYLFLWPGRHLAYTIMDYIQWDTIHVHVQCHLWLVHCNNTLFLVMTHIYTVIKITTSSMYLSNKKPCNCPCLKSTTFSVCQQDKHIITTRTVLSWCCRIRQEDGGRICQTGRPSQPPHPLEQDKRVSYVRKGWEWNFRWMANTFVFKSMFFPFVFKYVLYCR